MSAGFDDMSCVVRAAARRATAANDDGCVVCTFCQWEAAVY
jgi:hypothetical protein